MSDEEHPLDWAIGGIAQVFDTVSTIAERSGELTDQDRRQFAETGAAAFNAGVSLSGLVDSYLGGAGEIWEHVFTHADPARTVELSRSLRGVSQQAISSLVEGYDAAQRLTIRAEESLRRSFLDALVDPQAHPAALADGAAELDFPDFEIVTVAVAGADRAINDGGPVHRRVKAEVESRAPHRHILVTARTANIVVIAADTTPEVLGALVRSALETIPDIDWHIGLGQRAQALATVSTSYRQATEAMRLARAFGLDRPAEYDRILELRVLSSDLELTRALVDQILGPLLERSDRELVATLGSFFEHGGNMADVARELSVGARTVAYRLDRIAALTGYSLRRPGERFVLELAYRALPLTTPKPPRT